MFCFHHKFAPLRYLYHQILSRMRNNVLVIREEDHDIVCMIGLIRKYVVKKDPSIGQPVHRSYTTVVKHGSV